MKSEEVVNLYKRGHSVDYIINQYYKKVNKKDRIIKLNNRRILFVDEKITKNKCREIVYKILYKLNKNRY